MRGGDLPFWVVVIVAWFWVWLLFVGVFDACICVTVGGCVGI